MSHTIDEAAGRSGLSKHTLRYYEREGLLPPVAKGADGHRRYTDEDLGWLQMLVLLRSSGMPIRRMKEFMALTWEGDHTIADRVEVLADVRAGLVARMADDREHLAYLDRKLAYYAGVLELTDATPQDLGAAEAAERT